MYMEFNDNSSALYVDPNAYIQSKPKCEPKKVVFSEPYETMPNFYINNDFKKGDCNCVPNCKNKPHQKPCFDDKNNCNKPQQNSGGFPFNFNLKSLLPLLSAFGKGGGGLGEILSSITPGGNQTDNAGGLNMNNISSLISNLAGSGGLNSILNLFKGKKTTNSKITEKSTDFCIKDYQRIE